MKTFLRNSLVRTTGILTALAVGVLTTSVSNAQQYGAGQMPMRGQTRQQLTNNGRVPTDQRTPISVSGTIEGVGARGLQINADGATWLVQRDRVCKVEVTGTADPSYLKAGLILRFTADFDKKGKASAPLNDMEIVDMQTAMVAAKGEKGEGAAKDPEAKKGAKGEKGATAAAAGEQIVAKVTGLKGNELSLTTASGDAYKADLGPNPAIKVNISNATVAQQGDKIDLKGYYTQPGIAFAQDIKITLANPLGDNTAKKKTPAKAAADKAAK